MNNDYIIPDTFNGADREYLAELVTYKGTTGITYKFKELGSGIPIIKIVADFNNGAPVVIRNFSYEDPNNIMEDMNTTYEPTDSTQYIVYYPTFFIFFANFTKLVYQIPLRIAKSSFYSDYEKLTVASCQFIDDSNNSVFLTLDTLKGDILNLKIK
jgi:hypothetical protein